MLTTTTATKHSAHNGVDYEHTYFGNNVQMRGTDGSFAAWNLDHYFAVKRARAGQEASPTAYAQSCVQHPLTGKLVQDVSTGVVYKVARVARNWWRGHFLVAILDHNGSHRSCVIDAESCVDSAIRRQAEQYATGFTLVSKQG